MENYMVLALPCIGIALDVVTGYIAAMYMGEVDSKKLKRGLFGKLSEIIAIIVGFVAEYAVTVFSPSVLGVETSVPIGITVCAYVFIMEIVSVIENIGCMNESLGRKLVDVMGIDPAKVNIEGDKNGD